MLKDQLSELTKEAIKTHNKSLKNVVDDIKTAIKYWEVENPGIELNENTEMKLVKKLADQRKQTIETSKGREDLVQEAQSELDILKRYLPKEVTPDEIESAIKQIISEGLIIADKKNMGAFMKKLKEMYPTSDGKMVSEVVKRNI